MLTSKKRKGIIIFAVLVCIICTVACFLVLRERSFPIAFAEIHIKSAKTLDLRHGDPITHELTVAQIDDLKSRLLLLKVGKRNDDLLGFTPFFSVSVESLETGHFVIACYDCEGNNMAIIYKNNAYRFEDKDFWEYISTICAAEEDI